MKEVSQIWEERFNDLGAKGIPFVFLLDFRGKEAIIEENLFTSHQLLFDFNGISNLKNSYSQIDQPYYFQKFPISIEEYSDIYNKVSEEIQYGNTFLINLTTKTPIVSNLSIHDIFKKAKAKYKILLQDNFVCFSPETFIKVVNNKVSTYPMKGTIDATLPSAKIKIMNDEKEKAEHYTIVDLLRNDLSLIAKEVHVHQFRYMEKLKTNQKSLIQVSSEIRGNLKEDWRNNLGTMLKKLLPAGSISGAPKQKTVEIIDRVELSPRGWYTGICGIFDGKNLDTGVMIRFIEQIDGKLYFRSGGGITSQSSMKAEYEEMVNKVYFPF
jgi:para-aminobenzoate synthetase component I